MMVQGPHLRPPVTFLGSCRYGCKNEQGKSGSSSLHKSTQLSSHVPLNKHFLYKLAGRGLESIVRMAQTSGRDDTGTAGPEVPQSRDSE